MESKIGQFIEIEDGAYQGLGAGGKGNMLVKDCKLPVINQELPGI